MQRFGLWYAYNFVHKGRSLASDAAAITDRTENRLSDTNPRTANILFKNLMRKVLVVYNSIVKQVRSKHTCTLCSKSAVNVTSTSYINKGNISIPDDRRNKRGKPDTARHRARCALASP